MTNYNKRLDEVLSAVYLAGTENGLGRRLTDAEEIMHRKKAFINGNHASYEAKQAITSLIQELVAEAKPEVKEVEKQIPGDMDSFLHNQEAIWSEQYVTEFEQNLLKALEEK